MPMCCLLTWMSSSLYIIIVRWVKVVENRVARDLKVTVFLCSCIKCCSSSLKDDLAKEPHNTCFLDYLVGFSSQRLDIGRE